MAKRKKKPVVTLETKMKLASAQAEFDLEKKQAAIKAALHAATAALAATSSGLVEPSVVVAAGDGGAPPPVPWGEVIIGPIWPERNPPEREITITQSAEISFWD
jgi:hypothetical protein